MAKSVGMDQRNRKNILQIVENIKELADGGQKFAN